jgi:pimeloyl-ACP methyl ester carboxylesterase
MGSPFDAPEFNERLFFPRASTSAPPDGASDRRIVVDGAVLHLRWHRPLPAAITVLLFHGNGEVVADYDRFAPLFADCGANLAVVDYRGYGLSTGTPTLRDALRDAPAVVEDLERAGAQRLIVMGRSLGSASAAELYARARAHAHDAVVGFIWESGFVDLGRLVARRGFTPPAHMTDADVADFDARTKLRRGDRPLLILHGAEDTLIDPIEAQWAFYAAATQQKSQVRIPRRGHNDLSFDPAYWKAVKDFVSACP